jgi:hypothetical protein
VLIDNPSVDCDRVKFAAFRQLDNTHRDRLPNLDGIGPHAKRFTDSVKGQTHCVGGVRVKCIAHGGSLVSEDTKLLGGTMTKACRKFGIGGIRVHGNQG